MTCVNKRHRSIHLMSGALLLVVAMVLSLFLGAEPAGATTAERQQTDGSLDPETLGISIEEWEAGVQELIASEMPRTEQPLNDGTRYTFHVPINDHSAEVEQFDFTVEVTEGQGNEEITPLVGAGSDTIGAYLTLSVFEQNLILGGGGAALTAAACAIPGVGWISCGVITAALVAAGAYISTYGVCSGTLKAYIFVPERNRCL